jgi:hypothetical protein
MVDQLVQQDRTCLCIDVEVERLLDEHALAPQVETLDRTSPRAHPCLQLSERHNVHHRQARGNGIAGDRMNDAKQLHDQRHQCWITHP